MSSTPIVSGSGLPSFSKEGMRGEVSAETPFVATSSRQDPLLIPPSKRREVRRVGVLCLLLLLTACARPPEAPTKASVDEQQVAIDGYSPVSYVEDGQAVLGDAKFTESYAGATYHLTDAQQVQAFEADPTRYVPAFGGWCAYDLALGRQVKPDPTRFLVLKGKLLLFSNDNAGDCLALWKTENQDEFLAKAEKFWREFQAQPAASPR